MVDFGALPKGCVKNADRRVARFLLSILHRYYASGLRLNRRTVNFGVPHTKRLKNSGPQFVWFLPSILHSRLTHVASG